MTDWPTNLTVAPLREWPGALTTNRKRSEFRRTAPGSYRREAVPMTDTVHLLERELRMLGARDAEMLVAIAPGDFRLDGKPRASARAEHPGVVLSFESKHGRLSYPCDTFTTWQDNLRAIAKALEALRMVDRYGVTRSGEQYRGFLAIEATAAPAGFATGRDAHAWLIDLVGASHLTGTPQPAIVLRKAQRIAHPDLGGDAATFQRVSLAEAKLREEGLL